MKKILLLMLIVTLIFSLTACGEPSTTGQITSALEKDTTKLMTTINNLDALNSQEILINEISPINNGQNGYLGTNTGANNTYNTRAKTYSLSGTNGYNQTANRTATRRTNYDAGNGLYNQTTRTARNNAYLTDVNPNGTNTNAYSPNNNMNRINQVATSTNTYNGYNTTNRINNGTNNMTNYSTNYNGTNSRYTTNLNNYRGSQNYQNYNTNNTNNTNQNYVGTNMNTNYNGTNMNTNTNYNTTPSGAYRYIPMDEENNDTYNTNNNNGYMSRDNLNTYVSKVENMYNLTSDVFYANSTLAECKNALREEIQKTNVLIENIKDSKQTLTEDQKEAIRTHLDQIKAATSRLNTTKGEISKSVNSVKPLRTSFNTNMDSINANYSKILNSLSIRLTECQIALDSVKGCNNILTGQASTSGSQTSLNNYNAYNDYNTMNNNNQNSRYNTNTNYIEGTRVNMNRRNYGTTNNNANTINGITPTRRIPNINNNYQTTNQNDLARPAPINTPNTNMLINNRTNTNMNNNTNPQGRTPSMTTIPQINMNNNTAGTTTNNTDINQVNLQQQEINRLQQEIARLQSRLNTTRTNNLNTNTNTNTDTTNLNNTVADTTQNTTTNNNIAANINNGGTQTSTTNPEPDPQPDPTTNDPTINTTQNPDGSVTQYRINA